MTTGEGYFPKTDHFEVLNGSLGLTTSACDYGNHATHIGRDMRYVIRYGLPCTGRVNSISTMQASYCACTCHDNQYEPTEEIRNMTDAELLAALNA